MDKIEPCPICGNAAVHHTNVSSHNREDWSYYVSCIRDHCLFAPIAKTQDDAIAVWNRLSRAARLLAAVEGLQMDSVELVYPHHVIEVDCHYGLVNRWLVYTEQLANSERTRSEVSYETLADALIALGEATNG